MSMLRVSRVCAFIIIGSPAGRVGAGRGPNTPLIWSTEVPCPSLPSLPPTTTHPQSIPVVVEGPVWEGEEKVGEVNIGGVKREGRNHAWRFILRKLNSDLCDFCSSCDLVSLPTPRHVSWSLTSNHGLGNPSCNDWPRL